MFTVLRIAEDLRRLNEVHNIPIGGVVVAILYGNEDSPEKVETYDEDHCLCKPEIYRPNPA